jgi:hypothetical protein
VKGGGQRDGLGQPVLWQAPRGGGLQRRMQDKGAGGRGCGVAQALSFARGEKVFVVVLGRSGDQSSPS